MRDRDRVVKTLSEHSSTVSDDASLLAAPSRAPSRSSRFQVQCSTGELNFEPRDSAAVAMCGFRNPYSCGAAEALQKTMKSETMKTQFPLYYAFIVHGFLGTFFPLHPSARINNSFSYSSLAYQ